MKVIMLDLATADEWEKIKINNDSSNHLNKQNISHYNKIFLLHQVSKQDFYASYQAYQNNPLEMKILLDSLTSYSNKKRDSVFNLIK
jgi:hypothetical protein